MKDGNPTPGNRNKKINMLLHVCCANCALYPVEVLKDIFELTIYFYNPNIYPGEEYKKRLHYIKKIAGIYTLPLVTGKYDSEDWLNLASPYKNEPEGSTRCEICYSLRLEKTAEAAIAGNYNIIATTLSVSPHKNTETVNKIGINVSQKYNIPFYTADFKKKDGYRKTLELGKRFSIYRQAYCGCLYSMRK